MLARQEKLEAYTAIRDTLSPAVKLLDHIVTVAPIWEDTLDRVQDPDVIIDLLVERLKQLK